MEDKHFNPPAATAEKIPQGREKHQSYNRPATVDNTIATDGAYGAGEIFGGLQTVFDATLARSYDGLIVRTMNLTDLGNQQKDLVLHLFNEKPTDFNDHDDFDTIASAEDLRKRRRTVEISSLSYRVANSIAYQDLLNINADLDTRKGSKGPFYFVLVAVDGTYNSSAGFNIGSTFWVG